MKQRAEHPDETPHPGSSRGGERGSTFGMIVRGAKCALAATSIAFVAGCSANTASFFFDGVPAPPPPQEYCAPYIASLQPKKAGNGNGTNGSAAKREGSVHPPYQEKRCNDCHDKSKGTGLLYPKNELCLTCHDDIVKGAFVHAPAASGECVACHLPHDSTLPFLLKVKKADLCAPCHKELRVSSELHQRAVKFSVACSDCHNPHAGTNRYFFW